MAKKIYQRALSSDDFDERLKQKVNASSYKSNNDVDAVLEKGEKQVRLAYKDDKSDKVYYLTLKRNPRKGFGGEPAWHVVTQWGRKGKKTQQGLAGFKTKKEAVEWMNTKESDKRSGGYSEMGSTFISKRKASKSKTVEAKDLKPQIMKAARYKGKKDYKDWLLSEKYDGFRAVWDGEKFISKNGNVFFAPESFTKGFPKVTLDGELWAGRGEYEKGSSIIRKQSKSYENADEWNDAWNELQYVVFDAPGLYNGDGLSYGVKKYMASDTFEGAMSTMKDWLEGEIRLPDEKYKSGGDMGIRKGEKPLRDIRDIDSDEYEQGDFLHMRMNGMIGKLEVLAVSGNSEFHRESDEYEFTKLSEKAKDAAVQEYIHGFETYEDDGRDSSDMTWGEAYESLSDTGRTERYNSDGKWYDKMIHAVKPGDLIVEVQRNKPRLILAPQVLIKDGSKENIERIMLELVEKGAEGVMLRDPNSPYSAGRKSSIIKVKPSWTEEGRVVGYEEGLGKNEAKVGSLIVERLDEPGKTFKLSGMKDSERIPGVIPLNSIVEYKFLGKTKYGTPKHAAFLRIRKDMNRRSSEAIRNINGKRFIGSKAITTNKQYARKVAEVVRTRTNRNARVIPNSKGFRIYVGPNRGRF